MAVSQTSYTLKRSSNTPKQKKSTHRGFSAYLLPQRRHGQRGRVPHGRTAGNDPHGGRAREGPPPESLSPLSSITGTHPPGVGTSHEL